MPMDNYVVAHAELIAVVLLSPTHNGISSYLNSSMTITQGWGEGGGCSWL